MKNIFYIISAGILTGLFAFAGIISVAHAETTFSDNGPIDIHQDTFWGIEGSPYIIASDVLINSGATLTIGPGVEVRGSVPGQKRWGITPIEGTLLVRGSQDARVKIHDFGGIFAQDRSTVVLEYTDVYDAPKGVHIDTSRAVIATSTISNTQMYGIQTRASGLSIWDSVITKNNEGIHIDNSPGVFQARVDGSVVQGEIGGIGNALEDVPIGTSFVTVTNSIIEGNTSSAVRSQDWAEAHMENNWWGSTAGPGWNVGSSIFGKVEYEPWLTTKPDFTQAKLTCCSSVLFIPGLEASRLYRNEPGILGIGSSTNRLWEPNRNDDVRKLFLDSSGSSTDPSIYAGDPIGKAFGISGIYDSFMKYLDNLRVAGTIGEWQSYGYDWRKPIAEVVAGHERRATTTDSLIETLESLAARSKTGKVSIVAHSNGGLVAKYLIKTLAEMGKANLVDSVISVAVPYLGTPQAILGLLHGDGQSIAGGLILKQGVARELGRNMPSAYSLLPSREYFSRVIGPSIAFAATTTVGVNNGAYPQKVASFDGQTDFILDSNDARQASSSDLDVPLKGNRSLLVAADILHALLDPFEWPAAIARWTLVGWGIDTSKAVEYSEKTSCSRSPSIVRCTKTPVYTATTTSLGDGTVVAPSAAYNAGTVTAIDLQAQSDMENKSIKHANILEASSTRAAIGSIITANPAEGNAKVIESLSKLPGVTMGEPDYSKETTFIVVSTHSPVDLHIYDDKGNHTGIAPLPAGMDEEVEEGLFTSFDEKIPGSTFRIHESEDGHETFISLPDTKGQKYSAVIEGTGIGEFTYRVEKIRGGEVLDSVEYVGLPVTPLMTASSTVTADIAGVVATTTLASSTPPLRIDVDGNGSADILAKPQSAYDPLMYLESLKKTVIELIGPNKLRANDLVRRIDRLEELVKKGKLKQIRDNVQKLKKRVIHKKTRLLTTGEKDQIIDMIDLFVAQFE